MFKDKFILGIVVSSIILLAGGIWFANRMVNSSDSKNTDVAAENKQLLEVVADDHSKGNPNAPIVLIEYLDLECSVCATYYPLMKDLAEEFGEEVLIVNRYFPLIGHKNAMNASLAVEAASKQGKYFEMHDLLFEKQTEWGGKQFSERGLFDKYALEIGLNMDQFKNDIDSSEVRERVQRDLDSGRDLGVNSTPTFYLAGEKIPNPRSLEDFRTLIKAALLTAPRSDELSLGEKTHEHVDFKVYIEGKQLDLTQEKYQSNGTDEINPNVHMHDGNGEIVHKHRDGVTLGYFLNSLKITLDKDCLTLDTGEKYCNDENNELRFFINGQASTQFESYELSDLDRVLISYGSRTESIQEQINSVSDLACIYSEKCPERGEAPTENCVGGLGTDC